jgi:hypothetical protein
VLREQAPDTQGIFYQTVSDVSLSIADPSQLHFLFFSFLRIGLASKMEFILACQLLHQFRQTKKAGL